MKSLSLFHRFRFLLLIVLATGLAMGCVSPSKETIDVQVEAVTETGNRNIKIKISEVVDLRKFSAISEIRDQPQLVTEGYDDSEVTSRTVGLFWTAGDDPLWDFVLPEGRTVTDLVTETLENAFREEGYTVVDSTDSTAIPVTAEILRFWTWNTGFWAFQFHFVTEVKVKGQVPPFEEGESVVGNMKLRSAIGASDRSYINTITKGLADFSDKLKARLR